MDTPSALYLSYPFLITSLCRLARVDLTDLDRDVPPDPTITDTFIASLGSLKDYVNFEDKRAWVHEEKRQDNLDDLAPWDTIAQNESLGSQEQQRQAVRVGRRARRCASIAEQCAGAQQA
ncbi:hypothetical protein Scep_007022 [Stephania cephalantha]|uniref:Uncharacterized protein n=1 Tax=Stephania cephalantha TaxID=152367 RepID=A0AAP0KAA3_9MAGN